MRRCVSQALLFVEVVGDATNGELVVGVAAEFVAGSWSFVQPGCFPVTRVGVELPLPPLLLLPVEVLPLWPELLVGTGVDVAGVGDVLLASMVGLVVICQFVELSGTRA